MNFFLSVLGVVLVLEGIPWFLSPRGTKIAFSQIFALPDRVLRMFGLFMMLCGLLAVFGATR